MPAVTQQFPPVEVGIDYDAAGAGYDGHASVSTPISGSWQHTVADGAVVIVPVCTQSNNAGAASMFTRTATYGTQVGGPNLGMTSLGVVNIFNTYGWVQFFALLNAPGGDQTIGFSITGGTGSFYTVAAKSLSYKGGHSLGVWVPNSGLATSYTSTAIASAAGEVVVQCFCELSNVAYSGYNAANIRWTLNQANGTAYTNNVAGDKPGAASVTFTATVGSNHYYGSGAVAIKP